MSDEYQLFNAHQEDLRRRVDSLVRAIFLISGGALTVSIGLFSDQTNVQLTESIARILRVSLWSLVLSIIFLALTLFVTIARDYALGERWRASLAGEETDTSGSPGWPDVVIWVLGVLGLLGFVVGILGIGCVATRTIAAA